MKYFFTTLFVTALSINSYACVIPAGTIAIGNPCRKSVDTETKPSTSTSAGPATSYNTILNGTSRTAVSVDPSNLDYSATLANTPAIERHPTVDLKNTFIWNITSTDQTISVALTRWAATAGWQVAWQAPRDLPAFRVSYAGDFESAVESLMRDSLNSDYPLHACLYDNKVVRVLHATQSCTR